MSWIRTVVLAAPLALAGGCFLSHPNPYESASLEAQRAFKRVRLPFQSGTRFVISQGAFGKASHNERGNEYQWDFDVPFGTPVAAVASGMVIDIWQPEGGAGCNPKFSGNAHNLKIRHDDGTVAQYVHVESRAVLGQKVKAGDVIAVTAKNGFICEPQLHFGIYRSAGKLYDSPHRESIPVLFDGIPGGIAREGYEGMVP